MASDDIATGGGIALADSKNLRFGMFFLLYFCQGLPLGLSLIAMPAWLAGKGLDAAAIAGVTSASLLPWGIKMFNGLIMERYAFLAMGRRRAWLVGAQFTICLALAALFLFAPRYDDLTIIATILFCMNLAATFQDAAIDGIAVDLTPPNEQGRVNSFMSAGQIIGMSVSGAAAGMLLNQYGLRGAAIPLLIFMALSMISVCWVTERKGERQLPWTSGKAAILESTQTSFHWGFLLKTVFKAIARTPVFLFLAAFVCYGIAAAMADLAIPLFAVQELGWASEETSNMIAAGGIVSGFIGLLVLGHVADRWGIHTIGAIGFLTLTAFYGVFALGLSDAGQASWLKPGYYAASIGSQGMFIAMAALGMRLCRRDVAASQFAIMMAVPNLSRVILVNGVDPLLDAGGYTLVWLTLASTAALGALFFLTAERMSRTPAALAGTLERP